MKTEDLSIAVLGGGNLGLSIAKGVVQSGFVAAERVHVTRRKKHLLQALAEEGLRVGNDNLAAVREADLIILAVKPNQVRPVTEEILPALDPKRHALISVATGVSIEYIRETVGKELPVFRAMPNTAIAIRESMTCLATDRPDDPNAETIRQLFDQLGRSIYIDEDLMAAATVIGACGIAYSMRYVRAASQGGIEIGFDAAVAQLIVSQTVKGAAALLLANGQHPEREIDKVTTPQGCTIAGLNEMEHRGFSSALIKGIVSSYRKIGDIEDRVEKKK
ncbi:pyrroline-5-carboxylate reductase [Catalinimonas alkaloidigena]|uniref:Pyrroline-5-carboxylate reductase n=1 Tax=Catalinimonas alkaloidigena TaxID=1075417 RepID=A0A1G9QMZ3_9BACT|nr:pyrroline-5-carboxylate reductase [Catalinimonas alkaloidigena]SDM12358.1 pyrroline-5-carboxylate reductase [Catalinimonas alkaloidigena]